MFSAYYVETIKVKRVNYSTRRRVIKTIFMWTENVKLATKMWKRNTVSCRLYISGANKLFSPLSSSSFFLSVDVYLPKASSSIYSNLKSWKKQLPITQCWIHLYSYISLSLYVGLNGSRSSVSLSFSVHIMWNVSFEKLNQFSFCFRIHIASASCIYPQQFALTHLFLMGMCWYYEPIQTEW